MLVSYNWLQRYFDVKLPKASDLADKIIFHSFEVEDVKEENGDWLLDIKVLPDRAHDCLCHYGIAKEVAALFNLKIKVPVAKGNPLKAVQGLPLATVRDLKIKIEDPNLCRRYIGRVVENIEIKESPEWLKTSLENLGQRAINNVVDISNYIMLDVGQPLHAFDADKVNGDIEVRNARAGEQMETLDGRVVDLDSSILVIADNDGPIAIAGIKGGKRTEIDEKTKNIILEAANFHPTHTRKASFKTGIRTDGSKRWENEISTEVDDYAMDIFTAMVLDLASTTETKIGEKIDVYPQKNIPAPIEFEVKEFAERLGVEIVPEESIKILESLGIKVTPKDSPLGAIQGKSLMVAPPVERLDLQAKENYVEEVGRIYGYEKITGKVPSNLEARPLSVAERRFEIANKIRVILKAEGFTEVYGYSFTDKGEVELANPLASDKKFLRTNLTDWLTEKIKVNLPYVLFDDEAVKVFEMGKVFVGGNEETRLGLGIGYRKKIKGKNAKEELENILAKLEAKPNSVGDETLSVQEVSFDELVKKMGGIERVKLQDLVNKNASYKIVSPYPRIIRDVAVWVPENTETGEVAKIIKDSAGELCVEGPVLFDEFAKEGRKSLAFRLVFQSYVKTLSDDEANAQMEAVIKALEGQTGFEVRK
ncbi:MAG: phenylalanine--tRNA ligase subunit beta [Candidatus Paceibacterota bacterium]|jgi:phenylalanyl-tRNA synthetase beta chain